MKVLLISPLPHLDPPCGDVTYTQTLLANPPEGVEYESYAHALARGTLTEHGSRSALLRARRQRHNLAGEFVRTGFCKVINRMRKASWLFWEPFRFFRVTPGEYDAIHLHCFSARILNLSCPLVISNAAPVRYLYTEARDFSPKRTRVLETIDISLGKALGVNVNSYYLPQASLALAMTKYMRKWYIERGVLPEQRVGVSPIFLPSVPPAPVREKPRRIGFIAKDFKSKGGAVLLSAFAQVRQSIPDAELFIIGSEPRIEASEASRRGIRWIPYVLREKLLNELLPSFDVFAYPTAFDGLPLVVLEALSRGIPVATSDYQAMPELVNHGKAGLISPVGDSVALATNILKLLEPQANAHYRAAAYDWFMRQYSAEAVRPHLRACYEAAMKDSPRADNIRVGAAEELSAA